MTEATAPRPAGPTARKLLLTLAVLVGVTACVGIGCSFIGRLEWSWGVWWKLRVFRLLAAATVGAALAVAGMALQGLLRNPLADPFILGVSSGAGVGYLLGLTLAPFIHLPDAVTTPVLALAGALVTIAIVYGVAQRRGRLDPYVLLLSGVIINVLNGALIWAFLLLVKTNELIGFMGWAMGHVPEWLWYKPALFAACVTAVLGGWALLLLRGAAFNTLGLGDEVASSAGVSVQRLRIETFIVVSLMTAAAVSLAGPVGFVGLIIPHICRLIVGPDHRRLALLSGFVGAIFLMIADTFCRTAGAWFGKGEIPLGVVTAFCGGPFFIFLLRRHGREGWS